MKCEMNHAFLGGNKTHVEGSGGFLKDHKCNYIVIFIDNFNKDEHNQTKTKRLSLQD
jgi:hypothetical protein